MKNYTERLFSALETELNILARRHVDRAENDQAAIMLCKKAMTKLNKYVTIQPFKNEEEEVTFFKVTKPKFYCRFIYYVSIYNFGLKCPPGVEARREYIRSYLLDIRSFFNHNTAFYQYYRSGFHHLDKYYFTRGDFHIHTEMEDFEGDADYATTYDYKMSKIMANEMFEIFLKQEQLKLDRDGLSVIPGPSTFPYAHPNWTGTQTDAVELIYALKGSGVINHGNIDIRELVGILEFIFQIELNEYYHKYLDIIRRKKEIPVFINKLKDSLLRQIDDKLGL